MQRLGAVATMIAGLSMLAAPSAEKIQSGLMGWAFGVAGIATMDKNATPTPDPPPKPGICPNCSGTGKTGDGISKCIQCNGTGRITTKTSGAEPWRQLLTQAQIRQPHGQSNQAFWPIQYDEPTETLDVPAPPPVEPPTATIEPPDVAAAAPVLPQAAYQTQTRYRTETRYRNQQVCVGGVCRIQRVPYQVTVPYQVQVPVAAPAVLQASGGGSSGAAISAPGPRGFASYGVRLRSRHWGFPADSRGSVKTHLAMEHGIDCSGMTENEARSIHDAIHEGEMAGGTASVALSAGYSQSVASGAYTTSFRPSGYYGSRGYTGRAFDGLGWYPGKVARSVVDILTPGIGPRARARRARR